jgi:hypothetical protein
MRKEFARFRKELSEHLWCGFARGPGPMKRGDRGTRRTVGQIERGGGNGGEPVQSPQGWLETSPAGHCWGSGHVTRGARGFCGAVGTPLPCYDKAATGSVSPAAGFGAAGSTSFDAVISATASSCRATSRWAVSVAI